jgi:hypothetical protein
MQLEIQLDDDSAEKLAYIQKQTNQDFSDAIKQAIEQYYNQIQTTQVSTVQNQTTEKSALTLFRELGLVGCIQGDPDLSVNYKTKMADYFRAKQEKNTL